MWRGFDDCSVTSEACIALTPIVSSLQVVIIPAGRASEVLLAVPAGARLEWRWAVAAHDVAFAVDCCEAPEALPPHAIRVAASLRGVHALAPGYAGPIPHHTEEGEDAGVAHTPPATAAAAASAPGPSIEGRTPWAHAVPAARHAHSWGAWTVPAATASPRLVRLRWDNGSSWLHSKTLSRRIDVVLAGALDDGEVRGHVQPCIDVVRRRRPYGRACGSGPGRSRRRGAGGAHGPLR